MIKNIAVLLATYNGKQWIREQVDSILNQKNVNVTIFISDDMSTDMTFEYLIDLYGDDNRVVFLENNQKFGKASKNFYRLIKDVNFAMFDYISLSDQDDIWYENRLIHAVNVIEKEEVEGYSSNVLPFWENGKESFLNRAQKQNKFDFIFDSAGSGCTYVMTKNFATSLQKFFIIKSEEINAIDVHDCLIYAFSRVNNYKWYIDPKQTLRYRQHTSNVLGIPIGVKAKLKRLQLVKSSWYRVENIKIIKVFNLENKYHFAKYILNKTYFNNLLLLRYVFYFRRGCREKFQLFILILLGIY